ncbi:MAG: hypothetical protein A3K90_08175 [Pelodictyon luteolum]|uniref:Phage holin family protein n=1 Tax=Pelodictyon luteolum TaxID=1100 RepID=A0A165L5D6_PELLU|nr:phage holin family protein [Pelodictyon luteolum]KZK73585.1 MAG: hypothetical protein A3K90_08175 [Pelodictyon luteolum]
MQKSDKQLQQEDRKTGVSRLLDETISSTFDDVKTIIDARMELMKIELSEKIALLAAVLVISLILLGGTAYLVTTVALFIGELSGRTSLGFLSVSLVFIGCFIYFTRFRPSVLKEWIQKFIISLYD